MARVLILGGGFGGLAAAHELRDLLGDGDEIVLVSRSEQFFMGFAKLWDLAGMRPIDQGTVQLSRLSEHGVRYLQAEVTAIDAERRAVTTSAGDLEGDALLVALGDVPAPGHLDLLQAEGAHNLYDADQLPAMRRALESIDGGRVLVSILGGPFKCPPAPYEAALLVDERLRQRGVRDQVEVAVSTPQPMSLPVAGPDASRYVADHLRERDIELLSPRTVAAVPADRHVVVFGDGSEVEFRVLLGVPASAPLPVLRANPVAAESGWIEPDRHTLRTAFERVYAVGDCTNIPTAKGALPKAGVFAAAEGQVAARNIAADLGYGDRATFDGHGYCFLELPDRRVAFVEGDFYAQPEPDVHLTDADEEQFRRKQDFERQRLDTWLG